MTSLEVVALVVGIPASVATFAVGGPAVWRFLCLPGKIDDQLHKLDKLDSIEQTVTDAHDAAQRAAKVAEEAHEEWKGATAVVRREMGRLSDQSSAHEQRIGRLDQRTTDLESRVRTLEQQ